MFGKSRMLALLAASTFGLAACSSSSTESPEPAPKLAAQAAATTYPSDLTAKTSDRVGCVVDAGGHTIRILNFGDKTINNAEVWVNSAFVGHVDTLPPMGYVKVDLATFYDKSGNALTAYPVRVNTVQVKSEHDLWTLMGPINQ